MLFTASKKALTTSAFRRVLTVSTFINKSFVQKYIVSQCKSCCFSKTATFLCKTTTRRILFPISFVAEFSNNKTMEEKEKIQDVSSESKTVQADGDKPGNAEGQSGIKPTKKQSLHDMLKGLIDGYNPDDEEASSEMLIKYLNEGMDQKAKIADALKNDPRIAQLLSDIVSGKRGAAGSLARYFGKDFLSAEEGSPEYEEILEAEEERKAEQEASEASKKEYQSNLEKSMPEVEAYCKEKGYQVDEFLDNAWNKLIRPVLSGLYSREVCEFIEKGFNYDKDINDASEAGYIKGRNENIHKMKEERGDGMPKISGSETIKEKPKKKENSFLDMALNA